VHGPWGHKEEITKLYLNKKDPRGKQNNPIMASMLKSIDESVGRVMDRLDELKLFDDTIVIFFSDNGGNTHSRIGPNELPPTNNAPLRGGKATIYEGGTREPLIVRWPGVVEPGSRCSQVVSSIDFYPTMLEIIRAKSKPGQILDGESILPLLRQSGKLNRQAIFCHFPHNTPATGNIASTYVRSDNWKLIRFYHDGETGSHRYELYNLAKDISETNNLAAKYPLKVRQLDALIEQHLKQTGALFPVPNPKYDPSAKPEKQQPSGSRDKPRKRR
jgi:arylsulfatase A-like enzyme